ncbi:MAG: MATE family efflux transporter [Lachnospiraceae bacterium]|nr:MATE family efflux transporter [Lachnospiraceae bacterium]
MKTDIKDMTSGSPARLLLAFSMPLMLGNLFQQLYTFVDAVIVGRCVSANALAALGATEWLTFIMFGVIQGITQGCSVVIAAYFGQKKKDSLKRAIYSGCLIAAVGAAAFTIIGQIVITPMLKLLHTPPEVFALTQTYLRILYAGVPVTFLYNIAAAILRALGNSRKPLFAMVIASIGNIALDLLLVMGLHMGIAGAAYGTVAAQILAAVYCVFALVNLRFTADGAVKEQTDGYDVQTFGTHKYKNVENKTGEAHRMIDGQILREQIKMGIPMGVQNIITAIGGLVVQATVNGFGVLFLTGYAAANKLYVLLEIAATSYGHGALTYTAQNKGADSGERVREGLKAALIIGIVTALMMSGIMVFAGRQILGMFIKETEAGITVMIGIGYHYLCVLAFGFPLLYCLYVLRACIQGVGDAVNPMMSSLMQVFMRVTCALLLTRLIGQEGVFWGEVLAWVGADVFLGIICVRHLEEG